MGTPITLSLNGVTIDWGQGRYWNSHIWLFPPGSLVETEYIYAGNLVERKPGFETTLGEARFRLDHLGYSTAETRKRFEFALLRWNRTADLKLSFDEFRDALLGIDFAALTDADLEPYIWDFRRFLVARLARADAEESFLEDFVIGLNVNVILRVLADRIDSGLLPLRWHTHDFIENAGTATLDDLVDIDFETCMANHTMLFGRLQDHSGADGEMAFDKWLRKQGLQQSTPYTRLYAGRVVQKMWTLPTAVRNMIHHPENTYNVLTDEELRQSIEQLLDVAKGLPSPLPGSQ